MALAGRLRVAINSATALGRLAAGRDDHSAAPRARNGRYAECQPTLPRLLASCPGVGCVVPRGELLPDFDVHAPLLSLPGIFHTTLDNLPTDVPYLFAQDESTARWRGELS